MQSAAIVLSGNSFIVTVNAASASVPVLYNPSGGGGLSLGDAQPPQMRVLNAAGGAMVWYSLTAPASAAVVIPVAGTTTLGTPQPVSWAAPGVEFIVTLPTVARLTGVPGRNDNPIGFWLNVIAAAAGQTLQCQLGDGS